MNKENTPVVVRTDASAEDYWMRMRNDKDITESFREKVNLAKLPALLPSKEPNLPMMSRAPVAMIPRSQYDALQKKYDILKVELDNAKAQNKRLNNMVPRLLSMQSELFKDCTCRRCG